MKRKILVMVLISCMILLSGNGVFCAEEQLTRGDFIVRLVESMGLKYKVPQEATIDEYLNLLRKEGLKIPADYDSAKIITPEEKAELLSQALFSEREKREEGRSIMEAYRNKAVILDITGSVSVKPEGEADWVPARIKMELTQGAYIKTGEGAKVSLSVGVAGRIVIKENTEVLLQTLTTPEGRRTENILLYLAMGEIYVDVRDLEPGSRFETHTPTTIAAVRGTTYIVKVAPVSGRTEVREEER